MASDDLASLAMAKTWLGLDDGVETEDDDLLSGLITSASLFIRNWCQRSLTLQGFTEIRDGTGGTRLRLRETPIVGIDSLTIDNIPIPAGDPVSVAGYALSGPMLVLNGYRFTRGFGNVVIAYQAGYQSVPDDLAQACVELVGARFRAKDRIGLVSKGLAGETTQFSQADMPSSVLAALADYRRVVPL